LVLRALSSKETEILAADAIQFAADHAADWRKLAHDWIVTAARLRDLEARAGRMVEKMWAIPHLPLAEFLGRGATIEIPTANIEIVFADAVRERIVKRSEIQEATNAG